MSNRIAVILVLFVITLLIGCSSGTSVQNGSVAQSQPTYGKIRGTITDSETQEKMKGAVIEIKALGVRTTTDANGHYNIDNVPYGTYEIVAYRTGYDCHIGQIEINNPSTVVYDIALTTSKGTLEGYVSDANTGAKLSDVTVSLEVTSTLTNSEGYYKFENMIACTYIITATKTGYSIYEDEVEILANQVITRAITLNPVGWHYVGNPGISNGIASFSSIYIYNKVPYIIYSDRASSGKATVMKYNGSAWELVGNGEFSTAQIWHPTISVYDGTPYVAFHEDFKASVMKYNGTSWEYVGNSSFSTDEANYTRLFMYNGTPYVAYADCALGSRMTVMQFTGSMWESVGNAGFSAGSTHFTSLCINNGIPYVAYRDDGNNAKASVMRFNGSSWEYVGGAGISEAEASTTSLFEYNGILYLSYQDFAYDGKISLIKYDNSNWEYIGNPGFNSTPEIDEYIYNQTYISNNIPYVAFKDFGYERKSSVMKYENNEWRYLGIPGFSDGEVTYLSFFIYNGDAYVAFQDKAHGDKISVMRYYAP